MIDILGVVALTAKIARLNKMRSIEILIQACPSFPSYTFILFGAGPGNGDLS